MIWISERPGIVRTEIVLPPSGVTYFSVIGDGDTAATVVTDAFVLVRGVDVHPLSSTEFTARNAPALFGD